MSKMIVMDMDGTLLHSDGALIYDVDSNDFFFRSTISKDNVRKVCSFYNQDTINFIVLGMD